MKIDETFWIEYSEKICNYYGISFNDIYPRYQEKHRYYHNWNHIEDLLNLSTNYGDDMSGLTPELLFAILFHDIIYDPKQESVNEIKSAELFESYCIGLDLKQTGLNIQQIRDAILQTRQFTYNGNDNVVKSLHMLDRAILYTDDFDKFIKYEKALCQEYQFVDYKIYKAKRIEFLHRAGVCNEYINYVKNRELKIAIYPGSFNPFHIGHLNILQKAEQIFDKVIVAFGINPEKTIPVVHKGRNEVMHIRTPKNNTIEIPIALQYHQVIHYDGLLTDCIKTFDYPVTVIRGLRNGSDLQYELNQYRFLQDLMPKIQMVSILCDREYEHISSSAIRSLSTYTSIKKYLPK